MKMEQTECSETLVYKIQTPENYPEESTKQDIFCPHRQWRLWDPPETPVQLIPGLLSLEMCPARIITRSSW